MPDSTTIVIDWTVVWPISLVVLGFVILFVNSRSWRLILGAIDLLGLLVLLALTSTAQWVLWGSLVTVWWPVTVLVIATTFIIGLSTKRR